MEGQPMVSYSTGSMNSLVDKLSKLESLPHKILDLREALVNLREDFFDKLARRREMNSQVEAWVKHVGELVFDVEDWIDQKGYDQLQIDEEIDNFQAQIQHARALCERYNLVIEVPADLHDPAVVPNNVTIPDPGPLMEEQTGIIVAVQDPSHKHLTSEHDKMPTDIHDTAVVPSNLEEKTGDQDPTDELLKHMTSEKGLKVVSILGMEGLGKTTLATKIFEKLQGEFECRAFVTLGRRPSMRETLMDILRQVKPLQKKKKVKSKTNPRGGRGTADQNLQKLITELWEYLCTKRYFILVDGIWSTRAWRIINCALPNENHGSRVLTTTCISEVAKCCSVHLTDVYQMKGLSEKQSRSLYDKEKIRGNEWVAEVTRNMITLCGGMPLAIIIAAGLLTRKYEELAEPNMSVVSCVEQYSTWEGVEKILQMSYAALSLPLKSCLLYLSVFREDYIIKKDRLIRLWMAEGFIPRKDNGRRGQETRGEGVEETSGQEKIDGGGEQTRGEGGEEIISCENIRCEEATGEESLWETGERYFNELIMKRLIQPVWDYDDDQAVGCTVHSAVFGFIKSFASNGNFITFGADLKSGLFPGSTHTVRRFSLDCYDDQDEDGTLASIALHLPRVRSVTALGDIEGIAGLSALTVCGEIDGTSVLPSFKLIRVLDLEDTDHLRSRHLEGIGGLVLLRHLGVAGTAIDKLPEEIGELEQLETLDLRGTVELSILPASISKLKRLAHLLIDDIVKLPRQILEMQGLEEVSTIGVDSRHRSIYSVVEFVKKLEQLSVLGIRLDGPQLSSNKSVTTFLSHARGLFEHLATSTKLHSLSLDCLHGDLLDLLLKSPPSDQLRRFALTISNPVARGTAHKMTSLVSVTHMDIEIIQLDDQVVRVLGGLPKLVLLKLVSVGISTSQSKKGMKSRCTVGMDHGFNSLKVFSFICKSGGTELEFTPGAMQELRRLLLGFSAGETLSRYGNFSFGIKNLSSLTRVHATINCRSATDLAVEIAENDIRSQLRDFSVQPTTEFSRTDQDAMLPDVKASKTSSEVKGAEDEIREQVGNFSTEPTTEFYTTDQDTIVLAGKAKTTTSRKNWFNGCIPNLANCVT